MTCRGVVIKVLKYLNNKEQATRTVSYLTVKDKILICVVLVVSTLTKCTSEMRN